MARLVAEDESYERNLVIFEGEFLDGEPSGFGRLLMSDGTCKEGIWVNANEGLH
jgi:hypothetical protein